MPSHLLASSFASFQLSDHKMAPSLAWARSYERADLSSRGKENQLNQNVTLRAVNVSRSCYAKGLKTRFVSVGMLAIARDDLCKIGPQKVTFGKLSYVADSGVGPRWTAKSAKFVTLRYADFPG